jgi:ABC-type transport system involved in multi-copper enzyme maturation permease subunit
LTAASFAGAFVFVVFVGAFAIEFGRGTFRTMLLRQPGRVRLLAGKMSGLLVFAAAVLVAFAVGTAWAGPIEHLLQDAWDPASRFFPGLLLEAFVAGGTPDVSTSRAAITLVLYVAAAGILAGTIFARRDVTA